MFCAGLAAYPTWIVAREIQPVEDQNDADQVENDASDTGDEKATALEKVRSVDGDEKGQPETTLTSVGGK